MTHQRGRHKIFLGMAAGVGKTYRMLQEGNAEADQDNDVVIGYLEPHDRAETIEQTAGLEILPRQKISYRATSFEEMDLDAVLKRRPQLCLVDELAHTNAPGMRFEKRWQDVRTILNAGIDVFSTVNVQHLDSLNDQITELTGIRVRETVPDSILRDADEVVVVDLTPEALVQRLHAGKIYAPAKIESALNNFFRVERLEALREVALRQVAEEVEAKRRTEVNYRNPLVHGGLVLNEQIAERLLALVRPQLSAQPIVRRAWRSAQRLGAELDVLWVHPPNHELTEEETSQLDGLKRLTAMLGAHLLVEQGESLIQTVTQIANLRQTTYILLGTPQQKLLQKYFRKSIIDQLLTELPGVDIRIVTQRKAKHQKENGGKHEPT